MDAFLVKDEAITAGTTIRSVEMDHSNWLQRSHLVSWTNVINEDTQLCKIFVYGFHEKYISSNLMNELTQLVEDWKQLIIIQNNWWNH